jgi:hypothetical protein
MSARYDLFPAFVIFTAADEPTPIQDMTSAPPSPRTARAFDKARVIVHENNKVMVAIDGDNGPRIIFQESYNSEDFIRSANRNEDSYLTTVSGKKLVFRRNDACGCGSRLRSWNPYRTLNSTKDPTE